MFFFLIKCSLWSLYKHSRLLYFIKIFIISETRRLFKLTHAMILGAESNDLVYITVALGLVRAEVLIS